MAFSPDGKTVLTGSFDGMARLWDVATGLPIGQPLVHQGGADVMDYGPDGTWAHTKGVRAVAFSPDGKTVLTGSSDKTARLWDVATGLPIGEPLYMKALSIAVAFSPDGKTVLTGERGRDGAALGRRHRSSPSACPLAHRNRGHCRGVQPRRQDRPHRKPGQVARLWDAATGLPIGEPMVHPDLCHIRGLQPRQQDHRHRQRASTDPSTDAHTGSTGGSVGLWDAATGEPLARPLEYQSAVRTVAFSPDGETILVGSSDGRARLWDAATGLHIGRPLEHEHPEVRSVAFSPDGKTVLTGNMDGTAQLWDAATGLPIGKPLQHQGGISSVAFSPDGKSVLHRKRGQDGTALGRRHRPALRPAPRASRHCRCRGVQPRRQDRPHREL